MLSKSKPIFFYVFSDEVKANEAALKVEVQKLKDPVRSQAAVSCKNCNHSLEVLVKPVEHIT